MDALMTVDASESLDIADHVFSRPPSAIATLSHLISPASPRHISAEPRSSATLAVRNSRKFESSFVGPAALPTEILLLIFQFVFETCVDCSKAGTFSPEHATVWLEEDPLSPSLFPYSLASVCVRWLHVLSSVEVYWTRQVVTVDSHTPLTTIQMLLQWPGNHPLQLTVTRHPGIFGDSDTDEHARVQAVLDLLRPRIHQVWSLTLNVRYSSSLSSLWGEKGDPQYTQCLSGPTSTSSRSNTNSMENLARNSNRSDTLFRAHSLGKVTLAEHLSNGALVSGEQQSLWFSNITLLTIRGYDTCDENRISLHKFMTVVQTYKLLQKLTVEDIFFVNDLHPSCRFGLEVPVVCLRNIIDGDTLGIILSRSLGRRLKEAVTVSNCSFSGLGKRNSFLEKISSVNFTLENVNASTAAIQQLVCFWNGENLSLINCPGVSASFLRGVPTEETPPNLCRLRIVDCENASVDGLMALVRSRELQSVIDVLIPRDPDDEPCVALVELHVHGRGPLISTEQAVWFTQHLEIFSWDTIARDGKRYTWNTSTGGLIVLPTYD